MVKRLMVLVASAGFASCSWAAAPAWKPPEWSAGLQLVSSSDLFPGYRHTGSDRGLAGEIGGTTQMRVTRTIKIGVEASAGAELYQRFEQARYGWFGASLSARRGGTQLVAEAERTPRRVKFPAPSGDAAFRRQEWRLGVRQSVAGGLRLRVEERLSDDDYVPAFDGRDARGRGPFVQLAWSPRGPLALRAYAQGERLEALSAGYTQSETTAGGAVAMTGAAWRWEAGVRYGARRYPGARPFESNFGRRDQWIEATGTVKRSLGERLTLLLRGHVIDQTSTRLDRAYDNNDVRLGLEWTSAASR